MKTEDILNIDCRKEENKKLLNKVLLSIKQVKKRCIGNEIPLEVLEDVTHGFCIHYGYITQGISTYYEGTEKKRFCFYSCSILNKERSFLGCVYGITLWELEAKLLVKIYSEIKKEHKNES